MKMFPFCKENNYENRCWKMYEADEKCFENHRTKAKKSEMPFERGVKKLTSKNLPATRKWAQTDTSPLLKPFFNMRLGESL